MPVVPHSAINCKFDLALLLLFHPIGQTLSVEDIKELLEKTDAEHEQMKADAEQAAREADQARHEKSEI